MSQTDHKRLTMSERFAALSRVGTALMSELDESRLLQLIAETARDLTGAGFAAFTLRPFNEQGQPLVPAEGSLFYLASIVGVTNEQEALFRHMALGGEGLLAPIFRHGVPVRVPDALALLHQRTHPDQKKDAGQPDPSLDLSLEARDSARQAAFDYVHGHLPAEELHSLGVPRGHPVVRSFLGAPLLDREKQVRGGLLLGHTEPDQFTREDETILAGLAAQAAVALENARLYRNVQMRAQELDAIFESIADGVTLVDRQGRILRENGTARRLRENLAVDPQGRDALEALLHEPARHGLAGETLQDNTVMITDSQQEIREYLVNASPLHIPGSQAHSGPLLQNEEVTNTAPTPVSGAVVVWHDVTEARRLIKERQVYAETEARRSLLQLILDGLPSSVYLVRGSDARLVLANRAATGVWGALWPYDQPMGEFLQENGIRIFSIDGRLLTLEQLATIRAVQHGETVRGHQEIIRHADGTTLPVLVNSVAFEAHGLNLSPIESAKRVTGEEEEPVAIVVHQDVTALKEAEELKDEFIGIAAHELRTPLAVLKGFEQTLIIQTARGNGPVLAEWQTEALQGIEQATLRLIELTEDLLDVTRLQAGRLELHLEATDLVALTRRVVTRMRMTTDRHSISIRSVNALLEHLVVEVDPRRMEQVLSNLIGNAIKYSPEGGSIEITIQEESEPERALLSVSDHGIGISAQQQAQVFRRFVRADNARSHGIGGTGLGLYLCRELVERQGGRVWFESTEGKGSTFFISLPIRSPNYMF